jgi:predicted ferric reductase
MNPTRKILIWVALTSAIALPLVLAAFSPQLQWRGPVYISASFAAVAAMGLLFVQPLLIGGYLPNISPPRRRQFHRAVGTLLVLCVVWHVVGLWLTSPPDVIDVLLFRSPTPFSLWGVGAMWAVFAAALLAIFKRKLRIRPRIWRMTHMLFAVITVVGTVVHALLIDGIMETFSKAALSILVVAITAKLLLDMRKRSTR